MDLKTHVVLLAGGRGIRLGYERPKQLIKIAGKTLLEHTIEIFERSDCIDDIVLVVAPEIKDYVDEIVVRRSYSKISKIVFGGKTRRESSYYGVMALEAEDEDVVFIHDVARPFLDENIIRTGLKAAREYGAVDVVIDSPDTIVRVDDRGYIEEIPERRYLKRGQTPQIFIYKIIRKAHEMAAEDPDVDEHVTDDCGLILRYNLCRVFTIKGSNWNIKITYPLDVYIAEKIFQFRTQKLLIPAEIKPGFLKDKVVLIFGHSSGIGEKIYNMLVEMDVKTFGFSRRNGVDVRRYEDVVKVVEDIVEREGKVDFVINTAGILKMGKLSERSHKEIMEELETNYVGSINVAKASIPHLRKTKGMLILFSSSSYTLGRALYSIYSSTKAAVVNLAQALAQEEPFIRVNVICPERTATPMRFRNFGNEPKDTLLDPTDVARAAISLLDKNITGVVFEVKKDNILKSF